MDEQDKGHCPEDCLLKGEKCPIGIDCPPYLVRDSSVTTCEHYQSPTNKCPECKGQGYQEYEHGLVMMQCDECDGTGEVPDKPLTTIMAERVVAHKRESEEAHIGLLFQLAGKRTDEFTIDELWVMAKEASLGKMVFPYSLTMPCGDARLFESPSDIMDLPIEDIPCGCSNPNHHIVKFIDNREEIDGTTSRTGQPDNVARSDNTGKPKRTRKSKAAGKARKRAS